MTTYSDHQQRMIDQGRGDDHVRQIWEGKYPDPPEPKWKHWGYTLTPREDMVRAELIYRGITDGRFRITGPLSDGFYKIEISDE